MTLSDDQRRKYEITRQMAKEELEGFDKRLAEEVLRARQTIEELQNAKKSIRQIYDAACALLGDKSVVEMKDFRIPDPEKQA